MTSVAKVEFKAIEVEGDDNPFTQPLDLDPTSFRAIVNDVFVGVVAAKWWGKVPYWGWDMTPDDVESCGRYSTEVKTARHISKRNAALALYRAHLEKSDTVDVDAVDRAVDKALGDMHDAFRIVDALIADSGVKDHDLYLVHGALDTGRAALEATFEALSDLQVQLEDLEIAQDELVEANRTTKGSLEEVQGQLSSAQETLKEALSNIPADPEGD